jgi:hypothetical protein
MKDISLEESLVVGSKNFLTKDSNEFQKPLVVRGVTSKSEVDSCMSMNRDFYYIDTGYIGNFPCTGNPSGKKIWHRVVKNENQLTSIRRVPADRWNKLVQQDPNLQWKGWKKYNKKILLVMPNPKACRYYNINYDQWVKETTDEIHKHIDLPIEIRVKGSRSERNHSDTIYDRFDQGVYATVSMNSIASLESVLYGIPSFVSVPCAATPLSSNDLSKLKDPFYPELDTILAHCYNLAYGQFTQEELKNGTAWKILQTNYEIIS